MKIFLDNTEMDVDTGTNVAISLSVASHTRLEASKTGYAKTITIPMTPNNMAVMGDCDQISSLAMFNRQEHVIRVEKDGCTVIEGIPYLMECSGLGGGGFYRITIVGPAKQWVKHASQTPIRQLGIEFGETLSAGMIEQSWTWDKPVRFLPVQRDGFVPENANANLFEPQKILTYEDYHPFLHVGSMVARIFREAGYTVESQFMSGLMFDSLYMSGNYPTEDAEKLKARMDFKAGRFAAASSAADYLGRVYANPYSNVNTVGNLVETANPNEYRGEGNVAGVYSVGDCFRVNGSHVEFAPPAAVMLGFEYSLYYTTQYRVKNREELVGFDTVYLGDGQERRFRLANRYVDRKGQVEGYKSYRVAIFDFDPNERYRLFFKEIINPDADPDNLGEYDANDAIGPLLKSRMSSFYFETYNPVSEVRLMEWREGLPDYVESTKDWALYDGYAQETGTMDVEVTLRSSAEKILPSQPKTFYDIYFGGAANGMTLTLGKLTTVTPVFAYHPSEGSALDFAGVAAHNTSCLDLINALKQMFNLYFLTDSLTRTVYIEPRTDFYVSDTLVDWSGKVDFSKPVKVSELGADMSKRLVFGYAGGDAAVTAWIRQNGGTFGQWGAELLNRFAKDGEGVYRNAVFHTSISEKGGLNTAPSALLLHAGGSEEEVARKGGTVNFPAKIVRYLGMKQLPQGESWGWPANGSSYPFLAFHYEGDSNPCAGENINSLSTYGEDVPTLFGNGFSLCFEDRDGVAGIHRFWNENIRMLNESKRVELSLMLYPEDIEALVSPNSLKRDFRALYRFTLDGESAMFRLEEVCDYNPGAGGLTRCVFVKEF